MQSVFLIYAEFLKMSKKNRIRLFAKEELKEGDFYHTDESQAHYLKNVMRLKIGDTLFLFDGQNGEFECKIFQISKKEIVVKIGQKVFDFEKSPDIWLIFAMLKKENTDLVVQKAVELGASKIIPLQTEYCTRFNLKKERVRAQIIEAAEQSRRQDLPAFEDLMTFDELIEKWDQNRRLVYLNETGDGQGFALVADKMLPPAAVLIGPEGGFSKKELEILKKLKYTVNVSLSKRILRAETAAVAALACWQAFCGDWK